MQGRRANADTHSVGESSFAASGSRRYEPSLVLRKWGGGTKVQMPSVCSTYHGVALYCC